VEAPALAEVVRGGGQMNSNSLNERDIKRWMKEGKVAGQSRRTGCCLLSLILLWQAVGELVAT
jgi:hypothetical protein